MFTDPLVEDAARHHGRLDAEAEALEKAQIAAEQEFLQLCRKGDAGAPVPFAPLVTDWELPFTSSLGRSRPQRPPRLDEVISDFLELGGGPTQADFFQLALDVAYGCDAVNAPAKARALLLRVAQKRADHVAVAADGED